MSSLSQCLSNINFDRSFFNAVFFFLFRFVCHLKKKCWCAHLDGLACHFHETLQMSLNFSTFRAMSWFVYKIYLIIGRLSAEMVEKFTHLYTNIYTKYVQIHLIRAIFQLVDLRRKSWKHILNFSSGSLSCIANMIGVLNGLFDVAIGFHFWLAFMIFQ